MKNVLSQLNWINNHNYSNYTQPSSNGAVAVFHADVTRLLDDVDWADEQQVIDTDAMQQHINLLESLFTDLDIETVIRSAREIILNPITEWATRPTQIK